MLKELFSSTKRIVIKIIPHHAASIYKLEFTHRHLAVIAAGFVVFMMAMMTFQLGAVNAANAQVRKLQAADAQQHRQLVAFSKQTHDMMNRLTALQRDEREIRKLAVIAGGGKPPAGRTKPVPVKAKPANAVAAPSTGAPTAGRPSVSGQVSFWDRVRAWVASRSADTISFANESTALATLNVKLERALAQSRDLEATATAAAEAKVAADLARQRFLDAIPSMWPTDGYISSGFGYRDYPDTEFHPGLDIVNDYGSPVYATAAGVVEESGWDYGYGYKIVIDHGNGYETWYAHNSRLLVSEGETVRKGEEIAEIGTSGYATGPHCHYEIVLWGKPIDPTPYLNGVPAQVAAAR